MKPLAIDIYCGLGGWTEGLLSEGYNVIGFDIEAHDYGSGKRYPAQLVIQDALTIHGRQFKDAAIIVASPPCQKYSYMAMPWSRAKAIAAEYRSGVRDVKKLTSLFDACFRIQREAIEAAGHFIPMVVENVRGAQPWVGRARWNFGSYYLWGDVPALMPITMRAGRKQTKFVPNRGWTASTTISLGLENYHGLKLPGNNSPRTRHLTNQAESDSVKGIGIGSISWGQGKGNRHPNDPRNTWSKSNARKAASATIAKIPLTLSRWIARVYKPK